MSKSNLSKLLTLLVLASMGMGACGRNAATPTAANAAKVTASGYTCPAAEFPSQVTSTELNIFVWTEYIPQDMLECFELVTGIKVNRDEYSSNEEMFAKVSAGGTNYDLVQPTDFIIAPMARQNLLQELDNVRSSSLKTEKVVDAVKKVLYR